MRQFQTGFGRPIHSLQGFLRVIAMVDNRIPVLIPDGIYGPKTQATVKIFQREYGLPETGEVDNDTWDRVIELYTELQVYAAPPPSTQMFPASDYIIREGESGDFMYPIQAMIYAISSYFDNIPSFILSGVHTGDALNTTREIQKRMNMDGSGEIDVRCWQRISRLYENLISKDIFRMKQPGGAPSNQQRQIPMNEAAVPQENDMSAPGSSGLPLAPRLDVYEAGRPSVTTEPLPQQSDMNLNGVQPAPENGFVGGNTAGTNLVQENGTMRTSADIDSETLNDTDMQGMSVPDNPNVMPSGAAEMPNGNGQTMENLWQDASTPRSPMADSSSMVSQQNAPEQQQEEPIEQNKQKREPLKWDFF